MNKEDYFKYYIQGSDHYLIPKDIFNELFNEMNNWKEESKELNQKYLNAVVDYEITMSDKTELEKQLEYLRSGEYLNQLKFERNMLEDIVQNSEVSKEDKEFIDMTHRNTELLEENQRLKRKLNEAIHKATEFESEVYELEKQLEEKENIACNWKDSCLENAGKIEILENQQKAFISYLEKTIEELECENVDDEETKGYLIQRIDTFKEILSKYKSIIGCDKSE